MRPWHQEKIVILSEAKDLCNLLAAPVLQAEYRGPSLRSG